jgi:hypothetical protein
VNSKLLATDGKGKFHETTWEKPEVFHNEIEVKAVFTGICRSDIDMMVGKFPLLPIHWSGHEGVGIITKVGDFLTNNYKPGDFVATRGEPAYSDYYNVMEGNFVVIPELSPKYILEPVACALNILEQIGPLSDIHRTLIIGSGFLANVIYQVLSLSKYYSGAADVVGTHNPSIWGSTTLFPFPPDYCTYNLIIDLSDKSIVFDYHDLLENNGTLVIAAEKHPAITTDFSRFLWKNAKILFPSPRAKTFQNCMFWARELIQTDQIEVEHFWTRGYDRRTEWHQAFEDGLNRPKGYKRGYLKW